MFNVTLLEGHVANCTYCLSGWLFAELLALILRSLFGGWVPYQLRTNCKSLNYFFDKTNPKTKI